MLEEAAGTRLFEQKKDAALKTIEKKSKKVEEITTVSWHRLRRAAPTVPIADHVAAAAVLSPPPPGA